MMILDVIASLARRSRVLFETTFAARKQNPMIEHWINAPSGLNIICSSQPVVTVPVGIAVMITSIKHSGVVENKYL